MQEHDTPGRQPAAHAIPAAEIETPRELRAFEPAGALPGDVRAYADRSNVETVWGALLGGGTQFVQYVLVPSGEELHRNRLPDELPWYVALLGIPDGYDAFRSRAVAEAFLHAELDSGVRQYVKLVKYDVVAKLERGVRL